MMPPWFGERERGLWPGRSRRERCVIGDGKGRDGIVEPSFGEGEDVGFVGVEVGLEFGEFLWVNDGLNVEEEKGEELLRK